MFCLIPNPIHDNAENYKGISKNYLCFVPFVHSLVWAETGLWALW
jgi:hypothetical protein